MREGCLTTWLRNDRVTEINSFLVTRVLGFVSQCDGPGPWTLTGKLRLGLSCTPTN